MRAGLNIGIAVLTCVLVISGSVPVAWAQQPQRYALLIGNQGYNSKVGPLKNPHNDVALVGAALRNLRFNVVEIKDADYRSIDAAIKRHIQAVRRAGQGAISFVYYSGHGAADPDSKINYLIPVDVASADDEDLWNYSLNLNTVVESLRAQASTATHYVVFDACRNELNLTRKGKKALTDKGFVPIAYTPGVMVAYATAPGRTASDVGSGGGPYAKALADEIAKPGVDSMLVFTRVARRVQREIGQDPFMSASTMPEVYFASEAPAAPALAAPPPQQQPSEAERAWAAAKDTTSIAALEAFISRYKDTFYADLARARIDELKRRQVAVAVPPAAKEQPVRKPAEPAPAAPKAPPTGASVGYPDRPITMIVPYPPGGSTDTIGRILAEHMSKSLGQPVIIENKAGAGGMIGAAHAAKAKADGLSLLLGNTVTHAINPSLHANLQYDPAKDFELVALLAEAPLVLIAKKPLSTENNLKALIDLAKSKPGSMHFATSGMGSISHLGCELLNSAAGISAGNVPYRGTGDAINDVAGGLIDYMCVEASAAQSGLQAGTVQAVAVLGKERLTTLPNIRTAGDQGLKNFEAVSWNALFVPKGTPPAIIDKLRAAASSALSAPDVKNRLRDMGLVAVGGERTTAAYLASFVSSEIAKWAVPVRTSGAKAQ